MIVDAYSMSFKMKGRKKTRWGLEKKMGSRRIKAIIVLGKNHVRMRD